MNEKTNKTIMFAVFVALGLALVAGYSFHPDSVLAKSSSKIKGTSTGKSSSSSSSSTGKSSSSSSSSSGKLKSLVSCVTTSAKSSGGLSQNQVMSCFNQAYGNATGTTNSTSATLH